MIFVIQFWFMKKRLLDVLKDRLKDFTYDPAKHWSEYPCMTWDRLSKQGYGRVINEHGKQKGVHWIALELVKGPLPPGMIPDHLCSNPPCFCPAHLEAVTPQGNVRRANGLSMYQPGRSIPVDTSKTALLQFAEETMLSGIGNIGTRNVYRSSLQQLFDWMVVFSKTFNRADIQAFMVYLQDHGRSPASRNIAMSAIRRLAKEAYYAGRLSHEIYLGIADLKGARKSTVRAAQWLTLRQVNELLSLPDVKTMKGLRDRALLGVLVGCALRRAEVCDLLVSNIEQRSSRWVFIVRGKGEKTRIVGIASGLKTSIDAWVSSRECDDLLPIDATPFQKTAVLQTLPLFCAMVKGGRPIHRKITAQTIQDVLQEYSVLLDPPLPRLAPHDCRRTHARLAREAGSDLEQIQFALGHESIQTTTTYLGNNQNLNRTPGDMLDVNWEGK